MADVAGAGVPWGDAVLLPGLGAEGGYQVYSCGQRRHSPGCHQEADREVPARHAHALRA